MPSNPQLARGRRPSESAEMTWPVDRRTPSYHYPDAGAALALSVEELVS
jgi:hypothetical protein